MAHDPMSHVVDEKGKWTLFTDLFKDLVGGEVFIPLLDLRPLGVPFTMTKFMVLELIAAGLICAIFIPLARRVRFGAVPQGPWWNCFEALLTFVRDNIAKPTLSNPHPHHEEHEEHQNAHGHEHHAAAHQPASPDEEVDQYVPFLWTVFLFVLFCNLLGMVPLMGSPTASIWVTGALGLCSFAMMHGAAILRMGVGNYFKSLWPAMDIPVAMAIFIKPMIFIIELLGTMIKSGVLAVRLFANLFAGHLVLAYLLMFIVMANSAAFGLIGFAGVTVASVLGVIALSLLELFVAFLQAYIFTFLTALFMGMALHPQH